MGDDVRHAERLRKAHFQQVKQNEVETNYFDKMRANEARAPKP